MSTTIHIRKTGEPGQEQYVVPAVSIHTPQGKKLIPNPSGAEACVFSTLTEAEEAVRRAGFDYVFEGRKTYTLDKGGQKNPVQQTFLYSDPIQASVSILIERLRDREPSVIANAAFALGEIRATEALSGLCEILGHEDPGIRKSVSEALAKLMPASLIHLKRSWELTQKTRQKDAPYIRLSILSAYSLMAQTGQLSPEYMTELMPLILEGLQDESWLVKSQAALTMGHIASSVSQA